MTQLLSYLRTPRGVWIAAAIASAVMALIWSMRPTIELAIAAHEIVPVEGNSYVAQVATPDSLIFSYAADTPEEPRQSKLALFEDGKRLGPRHAVHYDIQTYGAGRYSHWVSVVYFSSSDGTDPRTNGRAYGAKIRGSLTVWLDVVFAFALAIVCLPLARRLMEWPRAIFTSTTVFIAAYLNYLAFFGGPLPTCLAPDSAGYLAGDATRTIGYPLFLSALQAICPHLSCLPIVQLNILVASSVLLLWSLARLTGRWVLASVAVVLLLANGYNIEFSAYMLTESLYLSALALHLTTVALTVSRPTMFRGISVGVSAAIVVLIRPAGYFLWLMIPLLLLWLALIVRFTTWRFVFGTLIAMAAPLLLAAEHHHSRFGDFGTQSIGGLSLLGQVLPLLPKVEESRHPALLQRLKEKVGSKLDDLPDDQFSDAYRAYTLENFNPLLWSVAGPELHAYSTQFGGSTTDNRIAGEVAVDIIKAAPMAYAKHVASHVFGLWRLLFAKPPSMTPIRSNCVENNRSVADQFGDVLPSVRARSSEVDDWLKGPEAGSRHWIDKVASKVSKSARVLVALGVVGGIGALCLAIVRRGRDPVPTVCAYCFGSIWAYFFLVAAVEPAMARYAVVASVPYWSGLYLFFSWLLTAVADRLAARTHSTS